MQAAIPPIKVVFYCACRDSILVEQGKVDPVDRELQSLIQGLRNVQTEQDYMMQREKVHRKIAESTNSRVRYWFCYQILLVAASVAVEVYYLKSFFEKRRAV